MCSGMQRLTAADPVFETRHRRGGTLHQYQHGFRYMTIVQRGAYVEVNGDMPRRLNAGSLVFHSADEEHADHFLDDALCLNVVLPPDVQVWPQTQSDPTVVRAIRSILGSFYAGDGLLQTSVSECVTLLRRLGRASTKRPLWLDPVLEQFTWCEPVPLRDAASMAGIHPVQFSRAFQRHVGLTSNEYRRLARVSRASTLLLGSTASLSRIATDCGFADQSHFTRTYTEALSLSPSRYRQVFAR